MGELIVRPSLKLIRTAYWFLTIVVLALVAAYYAAGWSKKFPLWVAFLPALLFLWPLKRHVSRQFTRLVVSEGKLKLETGVFNRSTRIMQLSKVQDVRVEQSFWQRLLNTGDLFVETAGETGQLELRHVDAPHDVSHRILEAAAGRPPSGGEGL